MRYESFRNEGALVAAAAAMSHMGLKQVYREQILELFAGKFGMLVDVIDPDAGSLVFLRNNFADMSSAILSHQTFDWQMLPLGERFNIAMRLRERTPDEFLRTVGLPVSSQLAVQSNALGKTALHWAAREWSKVCLVRNAPSQLSDYAVFVVSLLKMEPLVHALDKRGRSPLMYLLDRRFYEEEHDDWTNYYIPCVDKSALVDKWSGLLVDAGVSLPQYVARENTLLASRRDQTMILWPGQLGELSRLVLSEHQSLQLEVMLCVERRIWEFRPPPGCLSDFGSDRPKICWWPGEADGAEAFWQQTEPVTLRSRPFKLETSYAQPLGSAPFQVLFDGSQDDHSAMAALSYRDRKARDQERLYGRSRRSRSMPPPGKRFGLSEWYIWQCRIRMPSHEVFVPFIHRCLLDPQWRFHISYGYSRSWRACPTVCSSGIELASIIATSMRYIASERVRAVSERERLEEIVGT